jgi:hypothetical protein
MMEILSNSAVAAGVCRGSELMFMGIPSPMDSVKAGAWFRLDVASRQGRSFH